MSSKASSNMMHPGMDYRGHTVFVNVEITESMLGYTVSCDRCGGALCIVSTRKLAELAKQSHVANNHS